MKRLLPAFTLICFLVLLQQPLSLVKAATPATNERSLNVYFFWAKGCPHCAKEEKFFEEIIPKYPTVTIKSYEVSKDKDGRALLAALTEKLKANTRVPFTVVGEKYTVGYLNDETTGVEIENSIKSCLLGESVCKDIVDDLAKAKDEANKTAQQQTATLPEKVTLPLVGEIAVKDFSLPVLTVIFGLLDGFNPCAMWTLIFLIGLLLGMGDRKRMWILGGAFIAASAAVYFMFMVAWLKLILFLGFITWIRIIIGTVALGSGAYNLKEYFSNKELVCKVTNTEKRRRVFEKLRQITGRPEFWLALGGIILLAFAVNLVELICSAGLPAVYTQILALSNLAKWQYFLYIFVYIFFFMLDDMLVFIIAMVTLQATGITTKYVRVSHLIGGVLMLIIGALLILRPELLMFG